MQRVCFLLRVRPDRYEEYRDRHRQVWPELRDALTAAGWSNYSLFLGPDGVLIGYLETEDFERARAAMAASAANTLWQSEMAEFFEDLDGIAADAAMRPLAEVFHLA